MEMPKIRGYYFNANGKSPNATCVEFGRVTVWFSYQTPVAFMVDGHSLVVRENDWSNTTGRHLNAIDGGGTAKKDRVSGAEFQRLWREHVERGEVGDTLLQRNGG